MAERFFKKEVQKLYLGQGQEFRGEGIFAVTKALLDPGASPPLLPATRALRFLT